MKPTTHSVQNTTRPTHYSLASVVIMLMIGFILDGCTDTCDVKNEYTYYKPVYTTLPEIRAAVGVMAPQPIKVTGKIYLKGQWLFVNEPGEGIHIINNADPKNPQLKSFLKIPGNYDLAIKGNALYADSFIDLIVFDIADLDEIKEITRLESIFSNYNSLGFYADSERGVVTEWVETNEVRVYESDCDATVQPWGGIFYQEGIAWLSADASFNSRAAIAPGNGSVSGVGGSMARFTINKNHLYTLDGGDVQAIDISVESNPIAKTKTYISWDMETIFPYENNLFIGSRSGMHILDVTAPSIPVKVSTYEHVRVCDPVVVQDDLAYVTLRSGTQCEGFTNQLEVINIEDLTSPQLMEVYPMTNPHGLGIDEHMLFICDGDDGLKVYDASDITRIDEQQLAHYAGINAYDVIPFNNVLIMIGKDGIYQYDYSNPQDVKFLSKIEVTNDAQ